MPYEAYFKCKFNKQGALKGESPHKERKDWVQVLGFGFDIISPRDMATGLASGKRQYKPVQFLKEWGASSPQFLTAVARNETVDTALFEFVKVNASGTKYVYQTVILTTATISAVSQFSGEVMTAGATTPTPQNGIDGRALEHIWLTFQKIEVKNTDGKTMFADDWNTAA